MIVIFISMLVIGIANGFLLDSKNTSSLTGKPSYLTTPEYYEDKSKIRHDQVIYREQQEKTLDLLTNQLQQKFDIIEQILAAQTSNNELNETKKTIDALEQKFELKYNALQAKLIVKEQMYNELADNFTKQQQASTSQEQKIANLQQDLHKLETKCNARTNYAVNQTLVLEEKIGKLEQLKNIDQLQTLQTLQGQVQTFDSRINLLTSHEQARNQDFLALYNLTTSSRHELENKMNNKFQTIEKNQNMSTEMLKQKQHQDFQVLSNLTSESRNENEKLTNRTMKEVNELAKHTINEIKQMGSQHTSYFDRFQEHLDKLLQKVVVSGCTTYGGGNVPAGPLKFQDLKTSVGVPNLSSFQSTGKFTCLVPGHYHIVTTIMSTHNNARIEIMKNSNSIHWQYVTGHHDGYWKPGSAAVALELKTYDTVWIKPESTYDIYQSCLTIFKIN